MKSAGRWVWIGSGSLGLALVVLFLVFNPEKLDLDQEAKNQASGDFVQLSAGEAHYDLAGPEDAPLVVLAHGFSVPSYVWEPTFTALVDSGYQVLVYDLYGRGYSERVQSDYDIDLFTNQLHELLDALGVDQPVIVGGLSMGGPIAARFANLYPEQVSGVIFIAPEVTRPTTGDIFPLNLPLVGEYLMAAVMEPFLLPKMQTSDFVHPEQFPDWEDMYSVQLQYKGTGRALLSTVRNLTEHDPQEDYQALHETGMPTLLIWGAEDQTIDRVQIDILRQWIPQIQLEVIQAAGHLPHYERPEVVNPLLIEFLENHEN